MYIKIYSNEFDTTHSILKVPKSVRKIITFYYYKSEIDRKLKARISSKRSDI